MQMRDKKALFWSDEDMAIYTPLKKGVQTALLNSLSQRLTLLLF
jgi:hypothetical protein